MDGNAVKFLFDFIIYGGWILTLLIILFLGGISIKIKNFLFNIFVYGTMLGFFLECLAALYIKAFYYPKPHIPGHYYFSSPLCIPFGWGFLFALFAIVAYKIVGSFEDNYLRVGIFGAIISGIYSVIFEFICVKSEIWIYTGFSGIPGLLADPITLTKTPAIVYILWTIAFFVTFMMAVKNPFPFEPFFLKVALGSKTCLV
jgi:hypothetical protein